MTDEELDVIRERLTRCPTCGKGKWDTPFRPDCPDSFHDLTEDDDFVHGFPSGETYREASARASAARRTRETIMVPCEGSGGRHTCRSRSTGDEKAPARCAGCVSN